MRGQTDSQIGSEHQLRRHQNCYFGALCKSIDYDIKNKYIKQVTEFVGGEDWQKGNPVMAPPDTASKPGKEKKKAHMKKRSLSESKNSSMKSFNTASKKQNSSGVLKSARMTKQDSQLIK